jgi:hypothetical protein
MILHCSGAELFLTWLTGLISHSVDAVEERAHFAEKLSALPDVGNRLEMRIDDV